MNPAAQLHFLEHRGHHTFIEYPDGPKEPGEGTLLLDDGRVVEATFTAYSDENPPPASRAGRFYQHFMREVIRPRQRWYRRLFGI